MAKKRIEEYYKVDQRIHFTKAFKRRALLEYSRLKKPRAALEACGLDVDELCANDKKYASKLIHKWRRELVENPAMLNILSYELTDEILKREIEVLERCIRRRNEEW